MSVVQSDQPYPVGALARLSWHGSVSGVDTDPVDLTLTYKKPGQVGVTSVAQGSMVHDALGKFHYDVTLDTAGKWSYRFVTTGTAAGAEETSFAVRTLETV